MKKPMYVDEVECRVCGREMKEHTDFFGQTYFECHNPHCENCGLPDRIKKLMLEDEDERERIGIDDVEVGRNQVPA